MSNKEATAAPATSPTPAATPATPSTAPAKKVKAEDVDVHALVTTDEFAGQGGDYEVINGKRVLVKPRTEDHPEGNCARTADGEKITDIDPAVVPQ